MPNTYTQLYIQMVFAPKYRSALLMAEWKERLRMYITGIVSNCGHKPLAINNMPDHLHLFVGLNPSQSISDLMRVIKSESSSWINKEQFTPQPFRWQEGFGAFSYSKSQVNDVVRYIGNQQEHHKKISFLDEYRLMLDKFGIEYEVKHLFTLPQ